MYIDILFIEGFTLSLISVVSFCNGCFFLSDTILAPFDYNIPWIHINMSSYILLSSILYISFITKHFIYFSLPQ